MPSKKELKTSSKHLVGHSGELRRRTAKTANVGSAIRPSSSSSSLVWKRRFKAQVPSVPDFPSEACAIKEKRDCYELNESSSMCGKNAGRVLRL